jgi:hypothetical protein
VALDRPCSLASLQSWLLCTLRRMWPQTQLLPVTLQVITQAYDILTDGEQEGTLLAAGWVRATSCMLQLGGTWPVSCRTA